MAGNLNRANDAAGGRLVIDLLGGCVGSFIGSLALMGSSLLIHVLYIIGF